MLHLKKACLYVTSTCNFHCVYCFAECENIHSKEFEISQLQKIIPMLRSVKIEHIIISGGEPLLYNDIFCLINELVNAGFEVSLCTNGSLATEQVCKKLYNLGLKKVTVSIDSYERLAFESITGVPGSYELVIQGVRNLVNQSFDVTINAVLQNINYIACENLVLNSESLGAKEVCFTIPVCKKKKLLYSMNTQLKCYVRNFLY